MSSCNKVRYSNLNYLKCLLFLLLWIGSIGCSLYAIDFTGRVASATDDTPLSGATVRLLTLPDSTLLVGGFADAEGKFALSSSRVAGMLSRKKPTVKVLLQFTYIGYQETFKQLTVRHKEKLYELGDVFMQEEERILGEAVVAAVAPPVIVREDTIEYYASSYKTQPDATAEDLLKRLPGVEINQDGTITAQGQTVEQIYVDGKEFFGRNQQATTRNLTAEMIESVQVVDMKTEEARLSGIDDGERRKVINFKLKPKMRRGWFGNAAGAWGQGHDIDDRWDGRGMVGYFRGNSQNALVANGNNTNNAGFGDLGDGLMGGSAMRGMRQSGARGDGLNTNWSVGLNVGYDEGNRMRDANTPLAMGGDMLYGGSKQTEYSRSHRINYLKSGNTATDSENTGDNRSQNFQLNLRYEKSWGTIEEGQHRIQVRPEMSFNRTKTWDESQSSNYHLSDDEDLSTPFAPISASSYISQTQRSSNMEQQGMGLGINATYSYARRTDRGRRRSSVSINVNSRLNEGDHYTRSFTSYDSMYVADLALSHDTLIHQWQEEDSRNLNYSIRLTHIEPLAEHHTLEFSARANWSRRSQEQLYHFWDEQLQQYVDTIGKKSTYDYSSDTRTHNDSYTLTASYRYTSETVNFSTGIDLLPQRQDYTDYYDHSRDYTRHFTNVSPRIEYRYNWTRRTNLRLTLNGSTQQPSMNQLQARKNQTSATHVSLGNPDLDPSFSMNFTARFRTFNEETYVSQEVGMSARGNWNNLTSMRWYSPDLRADTTMTVNLSGLGDWNVNGDYRGSFPFYDNIWFVTTNANIGYQEHVGYANLRSTDTQLNHTRTTSGGGSAGIAFRNEKLNIDVRGNFNIQNTEASITTNNSLGTTRRFGVSGNINAHLPYQFTLSSDINYIARRGFSAGVTRNQTIWNAQLTRTFLQRKNLAAFVKVFDILREKTSISRSISSTSMTDRETTVLGQYFLVGCSIRFNKMGGRGNGGGQGGRGMDGGQGGRPDGGRGNSGGQGGRGNGGPGEGGRGGGGRQGF